MDRRILGLCMFARGELRIMNRLFLISCVIAAVAPLEGQIAAYGQGYASGAAGCYGAGCQLDEGFGNRVIKGKPFSAAEERHSLQVLGDGTRIENTETNRLFRDSEGRTRVEEMNGTVAIYDPVANLRVELDPAAKTARKSKSGTLFFVNSGTTVLTTGWGSLVGTGQSQQTTPETLKGVMAETTENLGSQNLNGVTAQGIRTTMTIPKGQIGNNKDIKVLTERWTSTDLQMLVKSLNSDPRFGETTYQLTKVVQSAPDPALFQIPADYTVTDQAAPSILRLPAAARGTGGRPASPAPAARGRAALRAVPVPPAPAPVR
jgi:hypothetical protein